LNRALYLIYRNFSASGTSTRLSHLFYGLIALLKVMLMLLEDQLTSLRIPSV
jgi:hypothetical protein